MASSRLNRIAEALLPKRGFERGLWQGAPTLSVVCDDGYREDYTAIAPVLESFGVKGTFAICSELIGQPRFMREIELADLIGRGHEIASHMQRHASLIDMHPSTCVTEMQASKDWLRARGAQANGLVYPFGANCRQTRALAAQNFAWATSVWPGINVGRVNTFALRRFAFGSFENTSYPVSQHPGRLLDKTCAANGWLIVMLHSGAAQRVADHEQRLNTLLFEAKSRGMLIEPMTNAIASGLVKANLSKDQRDLHSFPARGSFKLVAAAAS